MNDTEKIRSYLPDEVNGWIIRDSSATYDRETIFDYINGAGEVYRSYDFKKVTTFEYHKPDEPDILVELFDMGSSDDAYGVFSYAREKEESGIGQGYEYRGSLLNFWKGKYYVCVLARQSNPQAKDAVFSLARHIDQVLPVRGDKPELVRLLPPENLINSSIRYFHRHETLNYHYFYSEQNLLGLDQHTEGVMATYQPTNLSVILIRHQSEDNAINGYNTLVENYLPEAQTAASVETQAGRWTALKRDKQYISIVIEAPSDSAAQELLGAVINRLEQSSSKGENIQ